MAIQSWEKYIEFKKTKGKNALACLKEQKEETHEPPSSEIGEVVHEEDRNSLPSDSEKMKRHHMSMNNFLLKILNIISRHILPWK